MRKFSGPRRKFDLPFSASENGEGDGRGLAAAHPFPLWPIGGQGCRAYGYRPLTGSLCSPPLPHFMGREEGREAAAGVPLPCLRGRGGERSKPVRGTRIRVKPNAIALPAR